MATMVSRSCYANLETALARLGADIGPETAAALRTVRHWPTDRPVRAWMAEALELDEQLRASGTGGGSG